MISGDPNGRKDFVDCVRFVKFLETADTMLVQRKPWHMLDPKIVQALHDVVLKFQETLLPLEHHVDLFTTLLQLLELSALLVDHSCVGQTSLRFATVTVSTRRN